MFDLATVSDNCCRTNGLARRAYSIVTADNSHIPGTGLGLYLCQELARMHGGRIAVTSQVRHGSTFTLQLPQAVDQPVAGDSNKPRTNSRISSEKGARSSAGGV